ncbi:MAG: hypothetical protein M3268_01150 [Acidobacteriota bacterium]|nr:hypothetical protein [Acidobacteriota bacterium]
MAARKKRTTRKHTVRAHMQVLEFTRAGSSMDFEIFASGEKLGTIVIGRGSLTWRGKSRKSVKTFSWTEFAKLMDEQAYEQ